MIKQYSYGRFAKYYDIVETGRYSQGRINSFIDSTFKKNRVKSVLDFTAGTGAQALYLSRRYNVVANDLNETMLDMARSKARKASARLRFHVGDMRLARLGKFDAVISVFNAIGHFDEEELEKVFGNVRRNLKDNGLYIFDIFNSDYMRSGGFIKHVLIDVAMEHEGTKFVRFNRNSFDYKRNLMHINQEMWVQRGHEKPHIVKEKWDMQCYSVDKLRDLLEKTGFTVLKINGGWGKRFNRKRSVSLVIVAKAVK